MSKFMKEFNNLIGSNIEGEKKEVYSIPLGISVEELKEDLFNSFKDSHSKYLNEKLNEFINQFNDDIHRNTQGYSEEEMVRVIENQYNDNMVEDENVSEVNDDNPFITDKIKEIVMEEKLLLKEAEQQTMRAASLIKSDDEREVITAVLGNTVEELVDGINCNIIPIPLLKVNLILNIGINVIEIKLDANMSSISDMELVLEANLNGDGNNKVFKVKLVNLIDIGLATMFDDAMEIVEMNPMEFRGLTKIVDYNELISLIN